MNLLRVELSRFYARVLLWCVAAGLVAVAGFVAFAGWHESTPPSAAQLAEANRYYEQAAEDWKQNGEQEMQECLDQQSQDPDPKADYGCSSLKPTLEAYQPYTPTFADEGIGYTRQLATALLLAGGLMAVSFVAAEFSSGAISNWLTFAPRRGRVFLSKLGAAILGVLPVTILAVAISAGGVVLAFHSRGMLDGVSSATWATFRDTQLRILVIAPVAAAAGVALAFLLRHTAAVLGVVVGWAVLYEGILANVFVGLRPYSLIFDISAWVQGSASYYTDNCSARDDQGMVACESIEHTVHMTQAGLQLGGVVLVLVVLALLVFRRRDVA